MPTEQQLKSEKKYSTAVILSGIFGVMGIHHFYVERWAMGVFDLSLFVATLLFFFNNYVTIAIILGIIDLIHTIIVTYLLLVGEYKDGNDKLITYPGQKI